MYILKEYQSNNKIMKNQTFEEFLQDRFMALQEIGGIPITKDNCEDLFDSWCSDLDVQELIDYADAYGDTCYQAGKEGVE